MDSRWPTILVLSVAVAACASQPRSAPPPSEAVPLEDGNAEQLTKRLLPQLLPPGTDVPPAEKIIREAPNRKDLIVIPRQDPA